MSVINLKKHTPLKDKKYLFDANIWISIIGWEGLNSFNNTKEISSFFNKCINAQAIILLPAIVMSEIINRIHHEEHKKYKRNINGNCSYKDFRKTAESNKVIEDIQKLFISQIIKLKEHGIIEQIDDDFESIDIYRVVDDLKILDFNDYVILEICKKQDAMLVTNDSDFLKFKDDINILTKNSK